MTLTTIYESTAELYTVELAEKEEAYLVEHIYESNRIYVDAQIVETIAKESYGEDPYLIAIIISIIEVIKVSGNAETVENNSKSIDNTSFDAISVILRKYSALRLINGFQNAKWTEIKEVLNSSNPIKEFEDNLLS